MRLQALARPQPLVHARPHRTTPAMIPRRNAASAKYSASRETAVHVQGSKEAPQVSAGGWSVRPQVRGATAFTIVLLLAIWNREHLKEMATVRPRAAIFTGFDPVAQRHFVLLAPLVLQATWPWLAEPCPDVASAALKLTTVYFWIASWCVTALTAVQRYKPIT